MKAPDLRGLTIKDCAEEKFRQSVENFKGNRHMVMVDCDISHTTYYRLYDKIFPYQPRIKPKTQPSSSPLVVTDQESVGTTKPSITWLEYCNGTVKNGAIEVE